MNRFNYYTIQERSSSKRLYLVLVDHTITPPIAKFKDVCSFSPEKRELVKRIRTLLNTFNHLNDDELKSLCNLLNKSKEDNL